jgi:hypothetical protein
MGIEIISTDAGTGELVMRTRDVGSGQAADGGV